MSKMATAVLSSVPFSVTEVNWIFWITQDANMKVKSPKLVACAVAPCLLPCVGWDRLQLLQTLLEYKKKYGVDRWK